jgi:cell division protein FtsW (lipid II flippase)
VLLSLLPALILGAGVAIAASDPIAPGLPASISPLSLIAAGVAPLVSTVALRLLAPGFDRILVATSATLTAISAATLVLLAAGRGADGPFYVAMANRQGLFIAAGYAALLGGAVLSRWIDRVARYPFTLLALALGLTATTVVMGEAANGARLWLRLGAVRFQPSEVARVLLAAFVAIYLYERRHLIAAPWRVRGLELPPAPYLLPLGAAVLGAVGVLVLQNDLGMAALVVLGAFATLLGAQGSRGTLAAASLFMVAAAIVSYASVARIQDRVAGWLDPWRDPAGRGFQFIRAEYALAAGGVGGDPARVAALRVPEVHTDLILVAVGSELGWLAATAVLALEGILVCRCVAASLRVRDGFASLLVLSLGAMIGIQVLLIVGGTLRVLPLTGLTLPLVSYGGTSLVATLFSLGLVVGIGATARANPRSGRAR